MKSIITLAILSWAFVAQSASVLWNEKINSWYAVDETAHSGGFSIEYSFLHDEDFYDIYNTMGFEVHDGITSSWREISGTDCDLARAFRVILAEPGDEINHETASDPSRIVQSNYYQDRKRGLETIRYLATSKWTLYLGIEASIGDSLSGYDSDGNAYSNDPKIYGWVEFFVDNYTVTLGNTCLDLSGRPVVVGVRSAEPVPEPATGALALLGAGLLFRRRRRSTSPRPRSDRRRE